MTTVKIQSSASTFHAGQANTTYHMAANASINTATVGIDVSGLATGRKIEINGSVDAVTAAVTVGTAMQPQPRVELFIGKDAELGSPNASIVSYSSDLVIHNAGDIDRDVEIHGSVNLVNTGEISGYYAIKFYGESGSHVVRNAGTLTGSVGGTGGLAISGGGQIEKVINTGTIRGNVELGGANDTFIFKSGEIDGVVRGGYNDDLYITNKAGLNIVEDSDAGEDSVRSSVTFELQANVENLKLIGKKDIDAIGTGGNNELIGNSGRNQLNGWYGNDVLDGGAGNDKLTGGVGADEFHFQRGGGRDLVMDFDFQDHIYLGNLKGATDFDDMIANHVDAKDDDLWISYGKAVIVLKGTTQAELQAGDFDFG